MTAKKEWSNDLMATEEPVGQEPLPPPKMPVRPVTPPPNPSTRDTWLAELAKTAMEVKPKLYTITSNNQTAMRVVHDYYGNKVSIRPGATMQGVPLRPDAAEYLCKGDLTVETTR